MLLRLVQLTVLLIAFCVGLFFYDLRSRIKPEIANYDVVFQIAIPIHLSVLLSRAYEALGGKDPFFFQRLKISMTSGVPQSDENIQLYVDHFNGVRVIIYEHVVYRRRRLNNMQQPAIIFFHGGAYTLGSPESYDIPSRDIVNKTELLFVSVDYRLAPKYIRPTPLHDCLKAALYFINHVAQSRWNVDPTKIFIMGDSAGGHAAAYVTLNLLRMKNVPPPLGVIFIYPIVQSLTCNTLSYQENEHDFLISRITVIKAQLLYAYGHDQRLYSVIRAHRHAPLTIRRKLAEKFQLPELSRPHPMMDADDSELGDADAIRMHEELSNDEKPLFVEDLSNFPPSLFVACKYDVLRDDSMMMVQRLQKANRYVVNVTLNGFHGMWSLLHRYPLGMKISENARDFISRLLKG